MKPQRTVVSAVSNRKFCCLKAPPAFFQDQPAREDIHRDGSLASIEIQRFSVIAYVLRSLLRGSEICLCIVLLSRNSFFVRLIFQRCVQFFAF